MNNINDVMRGNQGMRPQPNVQPSKEISLSSVLPKGEEITIGDGDYQDRPEENTTRRVIPVQRDQNIQRTTSPVSSQPVRRKVDPSEFVSLPDQLSKDEAVSMEEKSLNILNEAMERKQREFGEQMEILREKSAENESLVEDGIEKVEGELNYLPKEAMAQANYEPISDMDEVERDLELGDTDSSDFVPEAKVYVGSVEDRMGYSNQNYDEDIQEESYASDEINKWATSTYDTHAYHGQEIVDKDQKEEIASEDIPVQQPVVNDVDKRMKDFINDGKTSVRSMLKPISKEDKKSMEIDPDDFSDIEIDEAEQDQKEEDSVIEAREKAGFNNLRSEILEKVINTAKRFDTSTLKISSKPITIQRALKKAAERRSGSVERTATWALMGANRPYVTTAPTGPEIVLLNTYDDGNNSRFLANEQQMRILYKHDANPYKPETFESWAKTIPYMDIEEIFAAVYSAAFDDANYMPYSCNEDKCKHMWLSDNMPIRSLAKFKNKQSEDKFNKIMQMPLTPESSLAVESVVIPINDIYAIGFKLPTIYNMLLELRSVDSDFINKYAAIVTVILYIDKIYMVTEGEDGVNLSPIGWKEYPGDVTKTFKAKIATYSKILNSFGSNEFGVVTAYINSLSEAENEISYEIPATTCPKCGKPIEAIPYSAKAAVFTRARLVDIASTSIE